MFTSSFIICLKSVDETIEQHFTKFFFLISHIPMWFFLIGSISLLIYHLILHAATFSSENFAMLIIIWNSL